MSHTLSKRLFYFLIIFTPLAFGTVEPWSYAVMEILTALAAVFLVIHILRHQSTLYAAPGTVPLLIFLLYILFQVIPLPGIVVEFLSPGAWSFHQTRAAVTGTDTWMTLSIYPKATWFQFFRYSTYVLIYLLSVQLFADKAALKRVIFIVVLFGVLLSFSSILQFYLTTDMALWFRHVPENSIIVGPYVCHNHYAGLMEMIFPVALALFFFYRPRIGNTSLLKGVAEIFSQEKANIHILIGCGALLILISIFVSMSRGGMISTCLALAVFTILLIRRRISKANTILVVVIILLAAVTIGWFGWDPIFDRFSDLVTEEGEIYNSRSDFWKASLPIIRDFPLFGAGFGTFVNIFPAYQDMAMPVTLIHAHNDYIELAAQGGLVAVLIIAAFMVSLFYKTYRMFRQRRDAFSIYLYMGAITGIIAIGFHSFVDFNLQIGANGLWFFFMAGLAVSASYTNIRKQSDKASRLPVIRYSPQRKLSTAIVISAYFMLVILFCLSNVMGRVYYDSIKDYKMSARSSTEDLDTVYRVASLAAKFDPLDGKYPFSQALAAWFLKSTEAARTHFARAVTLDPSNAYYMERFGFFLARQGEEEKARIAFEAAVTYDITEPVIWLNYGAWLLMRGEKVKGVEALNASLTLDEKQIDKILTTMAVAGMTFEEMEQAMPRKPASFIAFAKFLDDTGQRDKARERYLEAVTVIENSPPINRSHFMKIYQFFMKKKDTDQAMQVLLRAETALPFDAGFKIYLGDLYQRQGISFKAREKYEQALILDPKNKGAAKRLQQLSP